MTFFSLFFGAQDELLFQMSPIIGIFTCLARAVLTKRIFHHNTTVRLSNVRLLTVSSQRKSGSKQSAEENGENEPIKFSTSKASHRTWKVDRSMGSNNSQPLRRVIPISLFCTIFLLWCALREQSDVDVELDKQLHENFILTDEDKSDK